MNYLRCSLICLGSIILRLLIRLVVTQSICFLFLLRIYFNNFIFRLRDLSHFMKSKDLTLVMCSRGQSVLLLYFSYDVGNAFSSLQTDEAGTILLKRSNNFFLLLGLRILFWLGDGPCHFFKDKPSLKVPCKAVLIGQVLYGYMLLVFV